MPIFRVKFVKIYTGQKKFTWIYSWRLWQIWGMGITIIHPIFVLKIKRAVSREAFYVLFSPFVDWAVCYDTLWKPPSARARQTLLIRNKALQLLQMQLVHDMLKIRIKRIYVDYSHQQALWRGFSLPIARQTLLIRNKALWLQQMQLVPAMLNTISRDILKTTYREYCDNSLVHKIMFYVRGFPHHLHIALHKLDTHCWEQKKALL